MRLLLALMLISGAAHAQEVECPKRLPGLEAPKAKLTGGGMYNGPNKEYELVGEYKEAPGGYDRRSGFNQGDIRWLACAYEGGKVWWEWMDPKTTECTLQQRKVAGGVTVRMVCK